ncbi:MAG: sugar phosphate isomerase/epimerase [Clostridia bacterium]|nr:sugar phosphate isomerase/epimerase [Clostridia bacterium]
MHKLLCSTGTLLGRPNGRNFYLLPEFEKKLCCDGLELMFYDSWYDQADALLHVLQSVSLPIAAFHAEKNICKGLVSDCAEEKELAFSQFRFNCRFAKSIGAEKMVFHLWDGYMNDEKINTAVALLPRLKQCADEQNVLLTVENIVCAENDPFTYLQRIHELHPDIAFTYDTKMAAFHFQDDCLYSPEAAPLLPAIRHFHINDYQGGYKEWQRFKTLHPGDGQVDFIKLFSFIKQTDYKGDFTCEATSFDASGQVDFDKLNHTLHTIRKYIREENASYGP